MTITKNLKLLAFITLQTTSFMYAPPKLETTKTLAEILALQATIKKTPGDPTTNPNSLVLAKGKGKGNDKTRFVEESHVFDMVDGLVALINKAKKPSTIESSTSPNQLPERPATHIEDPSNTEFAFNHLLGKVRRDLAKSRMNQVRVFFAKILWQRRARKLQAQLDTYGEFLVPAQCPHTDTARVEDTTTAQSHYVAALQTTERFNYENLATAHQLLNEATVISLALRTELDKTTKEMLSLKEQNETLTRHNKQWEITEQQSEDQVKDLIKQLKATTNRQLKTAKAPTIVIEKDTQTEDDDSATCTEKGLRSELAKKEQDLQELVSSLEIQQEQQLQSNELTKLRFKEAIEAHERAYSERTHNQQATRNPHASIKDQFLKLVQESVRNQRTRQGQPQQFFS